MHNGFKEFLTSELEGIRESGLFKNERIIDSPQGAEIKVRNRDVLNFCANNYLGLGDHPALIEAAKSALDDRGYGLSSVRFICGTQDIHKKLENRLAKFVGMDDAILYSSCFDANGGLFETLMKEDDVIITDALNHASIIDGMRLSKAKRLIYKNCDMQELEERLKEAEGARFKLIGTDGVFSMDGSIAPLPQICGLAEKYNALVMVDDSHSTGFMGKHGRGTHEYHNVMNRVDIVTSTLGKALGGASGGFTAARQEIVDILRQRSRPYLFSNTVPPPIISGAMKAIDMLTETTALRDKLHSNTQYFRKAMTDAGFDIKPGDHPIVPIMLYDAHKAQEMAAAMLDEGIYVIGFFFPVVPKGQARIRVQISAAHDGDHLDTAIEAFKKVGKSLGVIK
ncbi:MAG: glycine C-acetyltransferase [Calditrichaeota bacterium]|nr:glycine C-acetyltransferase [Calditrichota bacterium]MCB9367920.1 glycine C-acetyltransferase [Calditrichota bacterium]